MKIKVLMQTFRVAKSIFTRALFFICVCANIQVSIIVLQRNLHNKCCSQKTVNLEDMRKTALAVVVISKCDSHRSKENLELRIYSVLES